MDGKINLEEKTREVAYNREDINEKKNVFFRALQANACRLGGWNVTSTESTTRLRLGWRTFKRQRTRSTECTKIRPKQKQKISL